MKGAAVLRRMNRLARDERGSELVEFAMAGLMLVAMVFGIIEMGLAMYAYHFASYAAQLGARYAMVRGADYSSTACSTSPPPSFTLGYHCQAASSDVQNYVQSLASSGLNPSSVSATATWPGSTPDCSSGCSACSSSTKNAGCMVKVQVTYSFSFLGLRFLPSTGLSLTSTAEKVIQE